MSCVLNPADIHLYDCLLVVLDIKGRTFHGLDKCSILELHPTTLVSSAFSHSKSTRVNHSLPCLENNKTELKWS